MLISVAVTVLVAVLQVLLGSVPPPLLGWALTPGHPDSVASIRPWRRLTHPFGPNRVHDAPRDDGGRGDLVRGTCVEEFLKQVIN